MKILVHDFCGYRFTLQFADWLATRRPDAAYMYNADYPGPVSVLDVREFVENSLQVFALRTTRRSKTGNLIARAVSEYVYSKQMIRTLEEYRPDVILSANCPSIVQYRLHRWCDRSGVRLIPWVQDLYGTAAAELLTRRIPLLGSWIGRAFQAMDSAVLRQVDHTVAIADFFRQELIRHGCSDDRISILPNWAPLESIAVVERDNKWSRREGIVPERPRVIYAGTLGMKHNPGLLVRLAEHLRDMWRDSPDRIPQVIVISQGSGADWLQREKATQSIENLEIFPFQPDCDYEYVLGAADVLIAVLEPAASAFSVPSKILSYLCAGRPIVGSIPDGNPAGVTIVEAAAGLISDPQFPDQFLSNVVTLLKDQQSSLSMGQNARRYAERHFDLDQIGTQLLKIIDRT